MTMALIVKLTLAIAIGTSVCLLVIAANAVVGIATALRVLRRINQFSPEELEALVEIMARMKEEKPLFHGFWLHLKARPYLKRLSRK